MKSNKKGQVTGLQGFVLTIVTVAVVLAVGLIVLAEMSDTTKEMSTSSQQNESVASGSAVVQSALYISTSACRNSTMVAIPMGVLCNISSTGDVTLSTQNFSDGTGFIDYTYYTPSAAYNSTNSIIVKLATVPTWIGIIIIVALAFIVLSYFMGRRQ